MIKFNKSDAVLEQHPSSQNPTLKRSILVSIFGRSTNRLYRLQLGFWFKKSDNMVKRLKTKQIFWEFNYILNFMYKNQGILFWECIISTGGGKGLICSTVYLVILLDCQEAIYNHSAITSQCSLIKFWFKPWKILDQTQRKKIRKDDLYIRKILFYHK